MFFVLLMLISAVSAMPVFNMPSAGYSGVLARNQEVTIFATNTGYSFVVGRQYANFYQHCQVGKNETSDRTTLSFSVSYTYTTTERVGVAGTIVTTTHYETPYTTSLTNSTQISTPELGIFEANVPYRLQCVNGNVTFSLGSPIITTEPAYIEYTYEECVDRFIVSSTDTLTTPVQCVLPTPAPTKPPTPVIENHSSANRPLPGMFVVIIFIYFLT